MHVLQAARLLCPWDLPGKNLEWEHIYMEFRKMLMTTLYAEQKNKRHRFIEQSFRLCGRRGGWDDSREQH